MGLLNAHVMVAKGAGHGGPPVRSSNLYSHGGAVQIGNADFAWFGSTGSKSRLNFLELLRAGHDDYAVNAQALDYMRQRALSGSVITRLAEHPVAVRLEVAGEVGDQAARC